MPLIPIDRVDDPRIDVYRGLRDHAARQTRERPGGDMAGYFIAEGDRVLDRARAGGHEPVSILIGAGRPPPSTDIVDPGTDIFVASDEVLTEITGRPELRDPLACFPRSAPAAPADLVESASTFAVLEGVNNPNNLGVIMRNAAGLGVGAVLLDPTCGDPLYRRAIRASMGQVFSVPHARLDGLPAGLEILRAAGVVTIALSPSASDELSIPDEAIKVAILLGAEGPGLTPGTIAAADHRMRIPMTRCIDSLNVASAAAIAFDRLARHRTRQA